MICPKCGFNQPDDIYCASCGVDVRKHLTRKRTYRVWMLIAFVSIGVTLVGYRVLEFQTTKERAIPGEQIPESRVHQEKKEEINLKPEIIAPENQEARTVSNPSPSRPLEETIDLELSAREWFERGKALDDDSDAEIKDYLMAIAVNPNFAPAYYRLGAIYLRRADYELADQSFRNFLKHASKEEKQLYDIHVFYSPDEVRSLLEEGFDSASPLGTIVRYAPLKDQIRVPALLNGSVIAHMQIDTGSEITVVSTRLANELGLLENVVDAMELRTLGEDIRVPVARLEDLQIGNLRKRNALVAIADFRFEGDRLDGILGMDFLSDYDLLIDNTHQLLLLKAK